MPVYDQHEELSEAFTQSINTELNLPLMNEGFTYPLYMEELILVIVFGEHESRLNLVRPGGLNLQYNLVVLQTSL